jgi:hypothetical protein
MTKRPTSAEVEGFVHVWVGEHLRVHPDLTNLPPELDRLAALLTGDARRRGISGTDMHRVLGDIDDYLMERYRSAKGP